MTQVSVLQFEFGTGVSLASLWTTPDFIDRSRAMSDHQA